MPAFVGRPTVPSSRIGCYRAAWDRVRAQFFARLSWTHRWAALSRLASRMAPRLSKCVPDRPAARLVLKLERPRSDESGAAPGWDRITPTEEYGCSPCWDTH